MPADRKYNEYDNFAFHPYNVLLVLLLMGLTALFLAMTASFLYTRVQAGLPPLKIPAIFLLNTLLLVASSVALAWAKRSYLADHTLDYQRALGLTILLSLLFLVLQGLGWKQLLSQNVHFLKDNSASYLYLISGLHFAHVVAGPAKRLKLRLLTLYWHFLDGLWIYLVLFFWFNSLWRA
jgi:cytochrome c oxidase subunit 3